MDWCAVVKWFLILSMLVVAILLIVFNKGFIISGEPNAEGPDCLQRARIIGHRSRRIINGAPVDSTPDCPWIAAVGQQGGGRYHLICTGSLMTPQHVLTAAHCMQKRASSELLVRFGDTALRNQNSSDDEHIQDRRVTEIIRHPDYVDLTYDVALLKLISRIDVTSYVKPIALAQTSDIQPDQRLQMFGFGRTDMNKSGENRLYKTEAQVISSDCCHSIIRNFNADASICTMPPMESTGGVCFGDSGGPQVYRNQDDQYVQVGVITGGLDRCNPLLPAVSQSIVFHREWIFSHIGSDFEDK